MMACPTVSRGTQVTYVDCGLGRIAFGLLQRRDEPFAQKYPHLLTELEAGFGEGERPMALVREQLRGLSNGG